MAAQLVSIAVAYLLYPLLIWVPGISLAYSTNLLDFRRRSLPAQLALGLLISVSCLPIVVYLLARAGTFQAVWAFYGVVWLLSLGLIVRYRQSLLDAVRRLFTQYRSVVLFLVLFLIAGGLLEVDWVMPTQVRPNLTTMDQTAHVAITDALTRTGVPPVNPFVYPGHPVKLFYYYGWYLFCSLADQLGGAIVTARAAVQAGKIYVALSVVALITAYLEILGAKLLPGIKRVRTGVAIGLLLVTGLDLLPWTFVYLRDRLRGHDLSWLLSIEWWNESVPAWVGQTLMAPHHAAGLVMCMTALLLLVGLWDQPSRKVLLIVLAALAFASAATTSVYVTMACAAGLFLWLIVAAVKGWWTDIFSYAVAGILALILFIPVAREYAAASTMAGVPLAPTIRAFFPLGWLPMVRSHAHLMLVLQFLFLPVNYFLELGFFLVAAILFWWWRRSTGEPVSKVEWLFACQCIGSLLIVTFLKATLRWNDLGMRGIIVAQFVLLLWSVPIADSLLQRGQRLTTKGSTLLRWPAVVAACLLLGFAGSLFELYNFRAHFQGPTGPATLGARDAYEWIDQHTPKNVVVLYNPDVLQEYFVALYGNRQSVADGTEYTYHFGGVAKDKSSALQDGIDVFSKGETLDKADQVTERYRVGVVVVLPTDPVWSDGSSWVWKAKPVFVGPYSRVYETTDTNDLRNTETSKDTARQ
jgi:hypothetical protein